jgi:hypothetical protein
MTTATRLIPEHIAAELHGVLARLRYARTVEPDHPVIPKRPHRIDCDICISSRQLDLLIDRTRKVPPCSSSASS